MTPTRKRRLMLVAGLVAGVGLATTLALRAFQENMLYFYSPTEFVEIDVPAERTLRIGGLVADGSVQRESGSMTVEFLVTDHAYSVPVRYTGVLPDLFREGQGVVARGRLGEGGLFLADNIMAKHDENYMPPEVAQALEAGKMRAIERAAEQAEAARATGNGSAGGYYGGGYQP
ncbi:MAG: cytochrome c maturation protein CcmE [Gammaproteobacteria bacterium]|nr:cytochrome c maturation protein CcmE [Gammaproteobacteria bacterium]